MSAKYRFQLHYNDGSGGTSGFSYTQTANTVCELNPKSASIEFALNKVGQVQLTVNKRDLSNRFSEFPFDWKGSLAPMATLWIWRNFTVIWAGYVWDIDYDTNDQTASITAEEIIGIYDRIELSADFPGNLVSDSTGDIIESLLSVQGAETAQMRVHDFSTLVPGVKYTGNYTPRWYEYQKLKVGDLVRSLLAMEGCDWHQVVNHYDASGLYFMSSGSPYFQDPSFNRRAFWGFYGFGVGTSYSGSAGRDWETGGVNPIEIGTVSGPGSVAAPTPVYPWVDVAFEWGKSTRQTVDAFKVTYSSRKTASRVRVGGFGQQGTQLRQQYGMPASSRMQLPQLYGSWDDPRLTTQTLVDRKALSIISATGVPQFFLTAKVRQPNELCSYDVISLGDRVRCTVKDTHVNFTAKLRILSITLKLDDRMNEWMYVDLAPDTTVTQ